MGGGGGDFRVMRKPKKLLQFSGWMFNLYAEFSLIVDPPDEHDVPGSLFQVHRQLRAQGGARQVSSFGS